MVGGWPALALALAFFFPSPICGFELSVSQWSVRVVVGGFVQIWWWFG